MSLPSAHQRRCCIIHVGIETERQSDSKASLEPNPNTALIPNYSIAAVLSLSVTVTNFRMLSVTAGWITIHTCIWIHYYIYPPPVTNQILYHACACTRTHIHTHTYSSTSPWSRLRCLYGYSNAAAGPEPATSPGKHGADLNPLRSGEFLEEYYCAVAGYWYIHCDHLVVWLVDLTL